MIVVINIAIIALIVAVFIANERSAKLLFAILSVVGAFTLLGFAFLAKHVSKAFTGIGSDAPILLAGFAVFATISVTVVLILSDRDPVDQEIEKAEKELRSK